MVCVCLFASPARADVTWGVNAGVGHSDNITRSASDEIDEIITVAGFTLELEEKTRRIDADVDADISYYDYMDNTYDSEVIGGLDGHLVFGILPERLLWSLEDNFGQARQNQFEADRPDNRENINLLSTGPDLTLNLGSTMSLLLSGRYALTQYEDSPLDNERVMGSAGLRRQLSQTSSLSLMAMHETTEYDDPTTVSEYEVQSLYARYSADGARTTLSTDLGYTELTGLGEDADGPFMQLNASRQLSAASTLTLGAGSQFSNGGDVFRRLQSAHGVAAEPIPVQPTQDAFENRFVDLGWEFGRNRTIAAPECQL